MPHQWKVLPFGLTTALRVLMDPIKPILFPCYLLDYNLILVFSKWTAKREHSFLCALLVHLVLYINFSKSELCLTQTFFGVLLGYMSISLLPNKLADIQQLALSLVAD